MSSEHNLNFLALDVPCEERLPQLVDEYNALADRWQQANERAEQAEAQLQRLREERQGILDCINLYGDETLHKALDDAGLLLRSTTEGETNAP